MALSKEEKKKIYEEEKERARARKKAKNSNVVQIGCFLLGLPFVMAIFITAYHTWSDAQPGNSDQTTSYEDNIGKIACNKYSGACSSTIVDVKPCRTLPEITCYLIDQILPNGEQLEMPVDNTAVKE